MAKDDIVPSNISSRNDNKFNLKIIWLIVLAPISFHYAMVYLSSTSTDNSTLALYIIDIVSIIGPLTAGLFSFVIAGFYRLHASFGKSFIVLGLGYMCAALAELIYGIDSELLGHDPYPSIADLFFALLNILWIVHIVMNTKFFAKTIQDGSKSKAVLEIRHLLLFALVFVSVISSYVGFSVTRSGFEANFEFFYGLIFIFISAVTLPTVLYAAILFRGGVFGKPWNLLILSFFINVSGDVWYYHLEIFGLYDLFHPVNFFWYMGMWIQSYALFKHSTIK